MTRPLLLLLTLGGCFRTTVETGLPPAAGQPVEEVAHFFLMGLIGEETFNLDALCPAGVSRIDEGTRAVDCVFGCASLGVYTPRTVRVTCANGAAFSLSPHPEQGVTSVLLETPPVEAP